MDCDRKLNLAAFELRKKIVKNARKYFEFVHGPKLFVPCKSPKFTFQAASSVRMG